MSQSYKSLDFAVEYLSWERAWVATKYSLLETEEKFICCGIKWQDWHLMVSSDQPAEYAALVKGKSQSLGYLLTIPKHSSCLPKGLSSPSWADWEFPLLFEANLAHKSRMTNTDFLFGMQRNASKITIYPSFCINTDGERGRGQENIILIHQRHCWIIRMEHPLLTYTWENMTI